MKLLLFALLFFPVIAISQITLTSNDFANPDDTVRMSITMDLTIDFSTTGANQTWDYSNLTPNSQELREFYSMTNASAFVNFVFGFFAPTNYQASYFLPNNDLPLDQVSGFLPVPITDVFQFSKKNNDSITSVGFAISVDGNEVPFKSDTIETRYKYPLTFNDSYSSRGYTNMDLNPVADVIWRQYRQRETNVDGWGSITTPFGTFNAIRLRHTIDEVDSIRMDFFGTGNPMWIPIPVPTNYIYEWWTNGEKEPILRIKTTSVFGAEIVSSIEYRDNYVDLTAGVEEKDLTLSIYPNPVSSLLKIDGLNGNSLYQIIGADGKSILLGETTGLISVETLAEGMYHLLIETKDGSKEFSFIKK